MVVIKVGPLFAILDAIHRGATIAFTVVIAGHILIAAGILPGYRGVWRSMHLGGRLPLDAARRICPGWTERELRSRTRPADPVPTIIEDANDTAIRSADHGRGSVARSSPR